MTHLSHSKVYPRVVSTAADFQARYRKFHPLAMDFVLYSGLFWCKAQNDLPKMVKQFEERIHFIHLRSTTRNAQGDFYEDNHLEGDVDMYAVIHEIVTIMQKRGSSIPVRPDHGRFKCWTIYIKKQIRGIRLLAD